MNCVSFVKRSLNIEGEGSRGQLQHTQASNKEQHPFLLVRRGEPVYLGHVREHMTETMSHTLTHTAVGVTDSTV